MKTRNKRTLEEKKKLVDEITAKKETGLTLQEAARSFDIYPKYYYALRRKVYGPARTGASRKPSPSKKQIQMVELPIEKETEERDIMKKIGFFVGDPNTIISIYNEIFGS